MKRDVLLLEIKQLLDKKTIHDIIRLTRALSIHHKANEKKDVMIDLVLGFAQATVEPTPRTGRGAPPKSNEYDKELADAIVKCREMYLADLRGEAYEEEEEVNDPAAGEPCDFKGILERGAKYFYVNNMLSSGERSIYIGSTYIEKFNLKAGDLITGRAVDSDRSGLRIIESIGTVNGVFPDMVGVRGDFESFKVIHPDRQLKLAKNSEDIFGRQIDFFAPLGKGQRSIIVTAPETDKVALLKNIASGIKTNHIGCKIIVLAIGAFPEEIAEFKEISNIAEVFCSEFSEGAAAHTHLAHMIGDNAERTAESNASVVLLVHGLDSLIAASRALEKIPDAPVEDCPYEVRRLLSIARNTRDNGSVTLLATLNASASGQVSTPSLLYAANMRVAIESNAANFNAEPRLNVLKCYSAKRELFTSSSEVIAAQKFFTDLSNGMKPEEVADIFKRTKNNSDIVRELVSE